MVPTRNFTDVLYYCTLILLLQVILIPSLMKITSALIVMCGGGRNGCSAIGVADECIRVFVAAAVSSIGIEVAVAASSTGVLQRLYRPPGQARLLD